MRKLFLFIAAALVSTGMWATDFVITLDQLRTNPLSGLVNFENLSDFSLSGGSIQLSSGNKDFTISSRNSDYKIKQIVFTTQKAVIKYNDVAITDNTFSPTTPATSFTLNLAASGGTAKITQMVITLTTSESETLEELEATALTDGIYTTGSTIITLSTNGGSYKSGPNRIQLSKSSNTRSLTIATSDSYNLQFVTIYYYDAIFSRTITASTGTYTPSTYTWTPGSTSTNTVTLTFATENAETTNIRKIYVGYASATPAETYDVTIDPNGGAYASTPEGWTLSEGVYTKSVAAGSFNVPDGLAYDGYDLTGWKDGQGTPITLPITLSQDITLVAQWTEHAVSSDATLSALSLAGYTFKETFDPATTAYTVTLPFYASAPATSAVTATANDANASVGTVTYDSENTKYSVTVTAEDKTTTKTYTITLNWAETPAASTSINIEQLVLDNGKSYDIGSALTAANIAYVEKDALDSLLIGDTKNKKTDCNEAYLGLKFKKSTSKVTIIVPSGEYLKVKFGAITDGSHLTVSVNGSTAAAPSLTNNVYTLDASEGVKEVVFALGGAKTVVFKQIMVNEVVATVRPFEATVAATTNGTASVDLAKYAKGEEVTVNTDPEDGYILYSIEVTGYNDDGTALNVEVAEGKFTMPGSPVSIAVTFAADPSALDNTEVGAKAVKTLKNGLLIIEKNGVRYNMLGERVQ